jgi:FMN-binding protein
MRRITIWLASTAVILVLLFGYRTSTAGPGGTRNGGQVGAQPPGVVTANQAGQGSGPAQPPGGAAVVNGSVTDTRWGPVQVQVTIAQKRITDVQALIYPDGTGHDIAINAYALPILREQALAAQSAQIDGVSGATVTSDGYRESLQAALDAAHFSG